MKFLLTLMICSGVEGIGCLPPKVWPEKFDNLYDCLLVGYAESADKIHKVGKEDVNKTMMHIKFYCTPLNSEEKGTSS
jgi:hypothetical protein